MRLMLHNSFMTMPQNKIDITSQSKYALIQRVLEMKGLLKVLQASECKTSFEVTLGRFFWYTDEQLNVCIQALTLNWPEKPA